MSIARNAKRRHVRYGILLSLITAAVVSGCGNKPQTSTAPVGQEQALQQPEQRAVLPPASPATATTKPAGVAEESARAQAELARTSAALKASQADSEKLKQELKAAQANLRGWHNAYKAAQAQAAAHQKAAALNARNAELQRKEAEAAATLREAREALAGPSQPAAPAIMPEAPVAAVLPAAGPVALDPAPAPVAVPPLGILRDVRPFRGRPYATLSIGHDAGVRRGMRFGLADPRTGTPAGVVTIDEVGPDEAGGVVEGTDPLGLRAGLTVHSLADLTR